jgi:hypothetical protein
LNINLRILILVLLLGFTSTLFLGNTIAGNVFAWTLTINLIDKPFGDNEAWVEVRGPDGYTHSKWYDWSSVKTGDSTGTVTMNIPESGVPAGEQYEVCASSGDLRPYVDPNCSREIHSSGNEVVTKSLL